MWNLRKCSAAALDMLSNSLGDEHILPLLLPIVEARLSDSEWRVRESAILALGAVSEGCNMGLAPYLAGMVRMLVPVLQVRARACVYACVCGGGGQGKDVLRCSDRQCHIIRAAPQMMLCGLRTPSCLPPQHFPEHLPSSFLVPFPPLHGSLSQHHWRCRPDYGTLRPTTPSVPCYSNTLPLTHHSHMHYLLHWWHVCAGPPPHGAHHHLLVSQQVQPVAAAATWQCTTAAARPQGPTNACHAGE